MGRLGRLRRARSRLGPVDWLLLAVIVAGIAVTLAMAIIDPS